MDWNQRRKLMEQKIEKFLMENEDLLKPQLDEGEELHDGHPVPPSGSWIPASWVIGVEWLPLEPIGEDDQGNWTMCMRGRTTSIAQAAGLGVILTNWAVS